MAVLPRFASNPVLTHKGAVRCNMLTGALVPRWGTVAGVPGPRRSADECDAGWFAPVATRRRPFLTFFSPSAAPLLLRAAELHDGEPHQAQPHGGHDGQRQPLRHRPAGPGQAGS